MSILEGLNNEQSKAVCTTDGPLLVLAGAGSGKTTVLTRRIAYIIEQGKARPWQILAITFTNKAASEMLSRITSLVPDSAGDMWIKTFHSACLRILRYDIEKLNSGFTNSFNVYDTNDQKRVVKDCLKELNLSDDMYPQKMIISRISDCKNKGVSPEEYENSVYDFKQKNIARVYKMYQARLNENNSLDFDDLLNKTVELFAKCPDVLEYYQNKFKYILVDEYQDTNNIQYQLVSMLAKKHRNLCVVGDDDQSIYKFRGADITNILDFEKQFPDAQVIKLEQNYRSTQNILDAANDVIKNNRDRKDKRLWTSAGQGEKITLCITDDQVSEAGYINNCIEKLVQNGKYNYNDIAVLYRTNAQTRSFEENFTCPYRILAGLRFYDRKEIKDIMGYLRVIYNPADDVNLTRIINVPKRGIGDTTINKIQALASSVGKSMFDIITDDRYHEALGRASSKIKEFSSMMIAFMHRKNDVTVPELIDEILLRSGYNDYIISDSPEEARGRMENIEEFRSKAYEYQNGVDNPTFEGFLDNISLVSDVDNYDSEQDAVVLMTLHSAKGLEFPVVFMCGMEKGLFPSLMSESEEGGMEEERRLCYVGITRAKEKLFMTAARYRTIFGQTSAQLISPFIDEIPDELIEDPGQKKNFIARQFGTDSTYESYKNLDSSWNNIKYDSRPNTFGIKKQSVSSIMDKYSMISASSLKTSAESFDIKKGDLVSHRKFGNGMVVSVTPSGGDHLVEILFDNVGTKNLMASIAKLKKI